MQFFLVPREITAKVGMASEQTKAGISKAVDCQAIFLVIVVLAKLPLIRPHTRGPFLSPALILTTRALTTSTLATSAAVLLSKEYGSGIHLQPNDAEEMHG